MASLLDPSTAETADVEERARSALDVDVRRRYDEFDRESFDPPFGARIDRRSSAEGTMTAAGPA